MSIENGVQGVLVDPSDSPRSAERCADCLRRRNTPPHSARWRTNARDRFLPPDYLSANLEVVAAVAGGELSSL